MRYNKQQMTSARLVAGNIVHLAPKDIYIAGLNVILLIAISFSDITFKLFGDVESNPFPLMVGIVLMVLQGRMDIPFVAVGSIITIIAGLTIFSDVPNSFIASSLFAYLQVLFILSYFLFQGETVKTRSFLIASRVVLAVHLAIGLMQYFSLFTNILQSILDVLLARPNAEALWEIGRGVTFITNEPSHSLQSMILPLFVLSLSQNKYDRLVSITIFCLTVYFSAAGVSAIYLLIVLVGWALRYPILTAGAPIIVLLATFLPGRAGNSYQLLIEFISAPNSQSLYQLIEFSSFRFPSVIGALTNLIQLPNFVGVAAWYSEMIERMYLAGFDVPNLGYWKYTNEIHPIKPYSLLANISLDFWWLGAAPFLYIMIKMMRSGSSYFKEHRGDVLAYSYFILSTWAVLFLSTAGKTAFISIVAASASLGAASRRRSHPSLRERNPSRVFRNPLSNGTSS